MASNSCRLVGFLVVSAIMAVANVVASSKCDEQQKTLAKKQKELQGFEHERERVSASWEQMKSLDQLETALLRHSRAMHLPKAAQIVRMRSDGTPAAGQYSVAKAEGRRVSETAMLSPLPVHAMTPPQAAPVPRPAPRVAASRPSAPRPSASRPAVPRRTASPRVASSRPRTVRR